MKKLICLSSFALAAMVPSQAEAAWGFTSHQGVELNGKQTQYVSPTEYVPSVDYKAGKILVQVDALETLASLTREDNTNFGLNAYYTVGKGEINNNLDGILQAGVSFDLQSTSIEVPGIDEDGDGVIDTEGDSLEYSNIYALAQLRMGAQSYKKSSKYGFGVYVVPGIGIANVPDAEQTDPDSVEMASEIAIGTGLQISIWKK